MSKLVIRRAHLQRTRTRLPGKGSPVQSSGALGYNDSSDGPAARPIRDHFPADQDVERALLGGALINMDAARIAADLDSADWFSPRHRAIAAGIGAVLADGVRPDQLTVADMVRRAGHEVVDSPELSAMLDETPSVSSASRYAEIIRRHAKHRRIVALSDQLAIAAMNGQEEHLETFAAEIAAEVQA